MQRGPRAPMAMAATICSRWRSSGQMCGSRGPGFMVTVPVHERGMRENHRSYCRPFPVRSRGFHTTGSWSVCGRVGRFFLSILLNLFGTLLNAARWQHGDFELQNPKSEEEVYVRVSIASVSLSSPLLLSIRRLRTSRALILTLVACIAMYAMYMPGA